MGLLGSPKCWSPRPPTLEAGAQDSPRGLMVFSAFSFSLEVPLDISAAMEKALAREESCGLGEALYSMAAEPASQ